MSPVKLSCAAGATLAFSRHTNRAVVVIRQDSVPGAGVLTSWKQCNTGGYTRSPGLSARLSPPGCCHIYHTHWRWQGKAVTITLAWLPLPFCSPTPNTRTQTHTHTYSLYLLPFLDPSLLLHLLFLCSWRNISQMKICHATCITFWRWCSM